MGLRHFLDPLSGPWKWTPKWTPLWIPLWTRGNGEAYGSRKWKFTEAEPEASDISKWLTKKLISEMFMFFATEYIYF